MGGCNVDPTLRVLGGRGRYQLLQVLVISLGAWGAAFQLLDNIFIGRKAPGHQCSPPRSLEDSTRAAAMQLRYGGNSSHVTYGACRITVHKDNHEVASFPCLYGYDYGYPWELSFRTEFDLVCDQALWADLLQTLVIFGQGFGAVVSSVLSDRYGRRGVLVFCQFGLFGVGLAIAVAPSYGWLAFLKFLVGWVQQGVVTGKATMSIELFPAERRSLMAVALALMWVTGNSLLALSARLLQHHSWRTLQGLLSASSLLLALLQMGYLDESLRWLVANGRKEAAVRVLKRAARVNRKDVNTVLSTLYGSSSQTGDFSANPDTASNESDQDIFKPESGIDDVRSRCRALDEDWVVLAEGPMEEDRIPFQDSCDPFETSTSARQRRAKKKLTLVDLFQHSRLRFYTLVMWVSWFTCAFCSFTLYLMSSSLHGDRFLNFFLTALTEVPSCLLFYWAVDSAGRKPTIQFFFILCAAGIMSSGFFRVYKDSWMLGVMSVLTAMLAVLGSNGVFGALFFYTPEVYPTNIRQQALGLASFAGRFGGMIAPFMVPLSEVIVWLPGFLTGTLCFMVVFLFRLLPETQGKELPQTLDDIDSWDSGEQENSCTVPAVSCRSGYLGKWVPEARSHVRSCFALVFESARRGFTERKFGVKGSAVL